MTIVIPLWFLVSVPAYLLINMTIAFLLLWALDKDPMSLWDSFKSRWERDTTILMVIILPLALGYLAFQEVRKMVWWTLKGEGLSYLRWRLGLRN